MPSTIAASVPEAVCVAWLRRRAPAGRLRSEVGITSGVARHHPLIPENAAAIAISCELKST
jgi:hypothetical protein